MKDSSAYDVVTDLSSFFGPSALPAQYICSFNPLMLPPPPPFPHFSNPQDPNFIVGAYYIAVHAYTNISYTVMAKARAATQLQNGVPQAGFIVADETIFYSMLVNPDGQDLTIELRDSGVTALYVSMVTTVQPNANLPSSYQFASSPQLNGNSIKTVQVPALTNANYPQSSSNGPILVQIAAVAQSGSMPTNFTILAFTNKQNVQLQSGVAVLRTVQENTYVYFFISVLTAGYDLSFIVTPISGDPDVYVSRTNPQPDVNNNDYKSAYGNSAIEIIDVPSTTLGIYYVGVRANTNTTFTIVAQLSDNQADPITNAINLANGVPQMGYARSTSFAFKQYYVYNLQSRATRLSISLTRQFGNPDLYVSFNNVPSPTNPAQFTSTTLDNDFIDIYDAMPGLYVIGIVAAETSAWTISITTAGTMLFLQDGIAVRDSVRQGETDYYYFPVDVSDKDITVSVTPLTGDPDLYVSFNYRYPNASNAMYKSTQYSADSILIPSTDRAKYGCAVCPFFVAVRGFTDTTYTVVASAALPTQLQVCVCVCVCVCVGACFFLCGEEFVISRYIAHVF
jgi:hypothetical protein